MSKCILITGGIRSGKSRFAQELAKKAGGKVLFIATAEGRDEEMRERIEKHKRERPAGWRTVEAAINLVDKIKQELLDSNIVILDCLNMLISNILDSHVSPVDMDNVSYQKLEKQIDSEIRDLEQCMQESKATFIIVSNEVGMGLVSLNKLGRYYQDLLGTANQRLSQFSGEVYLVISGIPVRIKPQRT